MAGNIGNLVAKTTKTVSLRTKLIFFDKIMGNIGSLSRAAMV
jgi:hypothetical protein